MILRPPRIVRPRGRLGWSAMAAAALLVLAVLFVWIAPYNVAARLPHLPGVSWLLHTYMRNAVETWSVGIEPPAWADLDDPALIRLGAGHFETGCAPCHGAPGRRPNPLSRGMRPAPPPLDEAVGHYAAEELYWLAWNGLKYTGMPAWAGEHRDDEPWALAAFLLRYRQLDPQAYAQLAYGEAAQGREIGGGRAIGFGGLSDRLDDLHDNCTRCHGADGLGRDGTAPKLAGQSAAFLAAALRAFAADRRPSGIMEPIAAALSEAEIDALAAHYAALPPFGAETRPADPALYAYGAELAAQGSAEVPSCLSCHGQGLSPPRNPLFPRLSGQNRRFLAIWLRLWRERPFGGNPFADVMHQAARWLDEAEIEALATFFAAGGGARN